MLLSSLHSACANILTTKVQRSLTCIGGCDADVAPARMIMDPLKNPGPETEVQVVVA